jgi:hypothetical protein
VLHFAELNGTLNTTGVAVNGGNGSAVVKSAEWMEVEEAAGTRGFEKMCPKKCQKQEKMGIK